MLHLFNEFAKGGFILDITEHRIGPTGPEFRTVFKDGQVVWLGAKDMPKDALIYVAFCVANTICPFTGVAMGRQPQLAPVAGTVTVVGAANGQGAAASGQESAGKSYDSAESERLGNLVVEQEQELEAMRRRVLEAERKMARGLDQKNKRIGALEKELAEVYQTCRQNGITLPGK